MIIKLHDILQDGEGSTYVVTKVMEDKFNSFPIRAIRVVDPKNDKVMQDAMDVYSYTSDGKWLASRSPSVRDIVKVSPLHHNQEFRDVSNGTLYIFLDTHGLKGLFQIHDASKTEKPIGIK